MDFEWQGGPIDPSSPFHKYAMKRTHSQFESPSKGNLPSLSEPNGKPWFFSNLPASPREPQPSPFRNPSFTTPRKPFDIDFSSGPESSPAEQADNEETPDSKPFEFTSNNCAKPSNKRNSLFGMYGKFAPSPSRFVKPFNDALEKRIHKRRRRAQDFSVSKEIALSRRSSDDTSDDEVRAGSKSLTRRSPSKPLPAIPSDQYPPRQEGLLTRIFSFLTTYPSAPAIIAKYLQILCNLFIFGFVFYLIWGVISAIRSDIDRMADESIAEVLSEMSSCSKNYIENRCGADARLPALEQVCSNWEVCMNRDPNAVKRARLSAHTFAEIFNSFVEPISLKTMGVMFTLLIIVLLVTNGTFTLYRRQYEHYHPPPPYWQGQHPSGNYQYPPVTMTPGMGYQQHNQLAWEQDQTQQAMHDGNQARLEWNRSPSKEHGRGRSRSPEKKSR